MRKYSTALLILLSLGVLVYYFLRFLGRYTPVLIIIVSVLMIFSALWMIASFFSGTRPESGQRFVRPRPVKKDIPARKKFGRPKKVNFSNPPGCPRCGEAMVLRTAKRGVYRGRKFWGCSKFPSCRGTRSI